MVRRVETHHLSDAPPLVADDQLWTALRSTFASPTYRPPMLPTVALKVMELSSKPNVDVDRIVQVLGEDAVLAGGVLRRCRSAAHAGRSDVRSLKQAVVRLGLNTVRNVMLEESINARVFRAARFAEPLEQVRRHGSTVAHFARLISRYTAFDPEVAFLCGLVHDVGIAAGLIAVAEGARSGPLPGLEHVWPVLDQLHEGFAGAVLAHWHLPMDVELVVSHHHRLDARGLVHPLAAVIALAEDLATELGRPAVKASPSELNGFDVSFVDTHSPRDLERARAAAGLQERQWALARKDATALLAGGLG